VKLSSSFVLCLGVAIASAQPVPGRKVLFIGLDGLRPDALMAANAPRMKALINTGAYSDNVMASANTVSGPGWSTLLCGVWPDRHGVVDNSFNGAQYGAYPHLFTRLRQAAPNLKLGQWASWQPIQANILGTSPSDYNVFFDYPQNGDQRIVDNAVGVLQNQIIDCAFVYLSDIDVAGHDNGFHPSVEPYLNEIASNDVQIGQLLDAVKRRPTYAQEDWLILLSTDHGGTVDGSHGRNEMDHRRIFMIANGSSVKPGIVLNSANQCDTLATIWRHFGLTPARSWNWASRAFGSLPRAKLGGNLVYNGDAEANNGGQNGSDIGIAGWHDLSGFTTLNYGAPNGYPTIATPGPTNRGNYFFMGGLIAINKTPFITQTIDLRSFPIQEGRIGYTFSAWLGGWSSQRDMMTASVRFLDARGGEISTAKLGPATPALRQNDMKFLPFSVSGKVPFDATQAEVKLLAEAQAGTVNDGYADNISFVLNEQGIGP
jgi:hypothetical protein